MTRLQLHLPLKMQSPNEMVSGILLGKGFSVTFSRGLCWKEEQIVWPAVLEWSLPFPIALQPRGNTQSVQRFLFTSFSLPSRYPQKGNISIALSLNAKFERKKK